MYGRTDKIHNFEHRLECISKRIKDSTYLSELNKSYLLKFKEQMITVENLEIATVIKNLDYMFRICRKYEFNIDFDKASSDDMVTLTGKIKQTEKALSTVAGLQRILKKFFSFVTYGREYRSKVKIEGYPANVRWMITTIPKKKQKILRKDEILTAEEVLKLIKAGENARNRALLAVLFETGGRIEEVGNLRIKDITPDDKVGHNVELIVSKTRPRKVWIYRFSKYILEWLNAHPYADDLECPLWIPVDPYDKRFLQYNSLRKIVKSTSKKVGITKRVSPHVLRHTRISLGRNSGELDDSAVKKIAGWSPNSNQLAVYEHLSDDDAIKKMKRHAGLFEDDSPVDETAPVQCKCCGNQNERTNRYCASCGFGLTNETMVISKKANNIVEDVIDKINDRELSLSDENIRLVIQSLLRSSNNLS